MSKSDETRGGSISSNQSFDGTIGTTISTSSQSISSSRRRIRRFRRSTRENGNGRDDALRKRYLYRLGINDTACGSDAHSDLDSITTCSRDSVDVNPSNAVPVSSNLMDCLQPPSLVSQCSDTSRCSKTEATNSRLSKNKEIVLLRKSIAYTTELKFDKTDPTDIAKTSSLSLVTGSSKYELSTAWSNHLLAIGEAIPPGNEEPLDGAYHLFSLPSDSSIASCKTSNCSTTRAPSADSLTEASSFNSNTQASSFSFQSMHREISEIHQVNSMSLSDHSTQSRRKVSFDSTVKATTIPARHSYSQRIRTRLWSSAEDIVNNAIRNEFEFSFDGRDWRKIREEADFVSLAPSSDEKIHPAHFYGWPYSSRSMPSLSVTDCSSLLERTGSGSSDEDGSDMHFCGVFGMEMNTDGDLL